MKTKYKISGFLFIIISLSVIRISYLPVGNQQMPHQAEKNGYYDYQGIIHFHTQYSADATGTFEEIAGVANQQSVDFMISTDHNTLKPLEDKKEGWYQKTLILVGEEISLPEGYLLAMDMQQLPRTPGETTEEMISTIVNQGGLAIIAHPDHPKWKWKGKDDSGIIGEEILDFCDQWYTAPLFSRVKSLIFYPFNSSAASMELYVRPDETLKEWDRRTQHRNMIGIFAADFHQAVRLTHQYYFPFPKVDSILPIAHNHILLQKPFSGKFLEDKKALYGAIRKGHLYVSMDILGNASGFLFSAKQGDNTFWMGDQLPAGHPTSFSVTLPPTVNFNQSLIHLYRNGEEIMQTTDNKLNYQTVQGGVYRVEVEVKLPTFWGLSRSVVWIYSNPIYLR